MVMVQPCVLSTPDIALLLSATPARGDQSIPRIDGKQVKYVRVRLNRTLRSAAPTT